MINYYKRIGETVTLLPDYEPVLIKHHANGNNMPYCNLNWNMKYDSIGKIIFDVMPLAPNINNTIFSTHSLGGIGFVNGELVCSSPTTGIVTNGKPAPFERSIITVDNISSTNTDTLKGWYNKAWSQHLAIFNIKIYNKQGILTHDLVPIMHPSLYGGTLQNKLNNEIIQPVVALHEACGIYSLLPANKKFLENREDYIISPELAAYRQYNYGVNEWDFVIQDVDKIVLDYISHVPNAKQVLWFTGQNGISKMENGTWVPYGGTATITNPTPAVGVRTITTFENISVPLYQTATLKSVYNGYDNNISIFSFQTYKNGELTGDYRPYFSNDLLNGTFINTKNNQVQKLIGNGWRIHWRYHTVNEQFRSLEKYYVFKDGLKNHNFQFNNMDINAQGLLTFSSSSNPFPSISGLSKNKFYYIKLSFSNWNNNNYQNTYNSAGYIGTNPVGTYPYQNMGGVSVFSQNSNYTTPVVVGIPTDNKGILSFSRYSTEIYIHEIWYEEGKLEQYNPPRDKRFIIFRGQIVYPHNGTPVDAGYQIIGSNLNINASGGLKIVNTLKQDTTIYLEGVSNTGEINIESLAPDGNSVLYTQTISHSKPNEIFHIRHRITAPATGIKITAPLGCRIDNVYYVELPQLVSPNHEQKEYHNGSRYITSGHQPPKKLQDNLSLTRYSLSFNAEVGTSTNSHLQAGMLIGNLFVGLYSSFNTNATIKVIGIAPMQLPPNTVHSYLVGSGVEIATKQFATTKNASVRITLINNMGRYVLLANDQEFLTFNVPLEQTGQEGSLSIMLACVNSSAPSGVGNIVYKEWIQGDEVVESYDYTNTSILI